MLIVAAFPPSLAMPRTFLSAFPQADRWVGCCFLGNLVPRDALFPLFCRLEAQVRLLLAGRAGHRLAFPILGSQGRPVWLGVGQLSYLKNEYVHPVDLLSFLAARSLVTSLR